MVHFGRYIKAHHVPGWETYYIGYKQLKRRINECSKHAAEGSEEERQEILRRFSTLLDSQVEKIVLFFLERQGILAGRLQELRERTEYDLSDENMGTTISLVSERGSLIEAYRQIGKDLLDLLQYVKMNAMGLRKILKKFDKRLGVRLREHYLHTRINHPYSQLQQVLRQVGIGAIIVTISRNLAELQSERWNSYSSFTLGNQIPKVIVPKEPIVKAIENEYQKLTKEASVLSFMASGFLLQPSDEELLETAEEIEYHPWSAYLNQLNTFLYMVNYYVIVPLNSVWLLLLGRALEGLGCARAINRRYIMHEVPQSKIRAFSAAFVSASALGMTVGPALASALSSVDFKVGGMIVNYCSASGWVLGFAWILYLLLILILFKEPNKPHQMESMKSKEANSGPKEEDFGALAPLLGDSLNKEEDKTDESSRSFIDVLKEMNLPIQILLTNYFMLKFASEMLISEATLVTGYYFSWSSSTVGWFLGALGLTVLPSSAVVANYISNKFQERLIIIWSLILTIIGVVGNFSLAPFIRYTEVQYIISALVIFVSTNILEGVDMSLFAKMMSPRLAKGLFNCGFLSTEAGTIARALADGLITLVGRGGMANLLNFTMIPTLAITLCTFLFTWFGYYSLY